MASGELPEEIIQKIQERLPVKSLMRFTCVSKWWGSIISDPKFAKSHYLLATQQQTLSRRILLWRNNRQFESLDLDTSSLIKLTFPINPALAYESYSIDLLGSCNGLVFLCATIDGQPTTCFGFYVWNPSTGFIWNLPAPSFHCDIAKIRYCGFGYVSTTDDYKVAFSGFIEGKHIFEIFSWRANSWKRIETPIFVDPFEYSEGDQCYSPQGTVSNEALHWIELFEDESSSEDEDEPNIVEAVLVFDLVNDVFRKLQLPINNKWGMRTTALGVICGGCLSVARFQSYPPIIEFWVMREYNVPKSWTKLYIINQSSPAFVHLKPWFCWESCIFTFDLSTDLQLNQLIRFNLQEEKTDNYNLRWSTELEEYQVSFNPVIGYDESLLRPHDYQA